MDSATRDTASPISLSWRPSDVGLRTGGADDRVCLAAGGDPDQLGVQLRLGREQLGPAQRLSLEGGEVAQRGVLGVAHPPDRRVGNKLGWAR